jgi:hypothetical protein
MKKNKDFVVFCHFSAIGKRIVKAPSLDDAKRIAESDESADFDEIIKLTDSCKIDDVLLLISNDKIADEHEIVNYKNWGSE